MPPHKYQIGVVRWREQDDISDAIAHELLQLGHFPVQFWANAGIPPHCDVIFSFAPYGKFLQIPASIAKLPPKKRPILVHWNTEGIPDPRLPWSIMHPISAMRSLLGRTSLSKSRLLTWELDRMLRFRYIGDYYYAYKRGQLDIFADSSELYAQFHRKHGLPTTVMPWGASPTWYDALGTARDIDVLWMGQRGSGRRSKLLDNLVDNLTSHRVNLYIADNIANPFVFGKDRTRLLNRAKITLNLTRTWYDDNFSRFALAAPNCSLIVSEPLLSHCSQYQAGVHYISAPIAELADTILYYLLHEAERQAIVENAYTLVTEQLTFKKGIETIMAQVAVLNAGKNNTTAIHPTIITATR
jgi:hypothetical protein